MHKTLNFKIKDWQSFDKQFTTEYIENCSGRFLLKRSRIENVDLKDFLNDLARAYKTAQVQYQSWRFRIWNPLQSQIKDLAVDNKTILHVKPTHEYTGQQNKWWKYTYSKSPDPYGWGYHFDWIEEPEEKINLELGAKLYNLDRYQRKFNNRIWVLEGLLKKFLNKYLYSLYGYEWLDKNQFSEKIVKFTLLGDEYWYNIISNKNGVAIWDNFIWQSNNTESIEL